MQIDDLAKSRGRLQADDYQAVEERSRSRHRHEEKAKNVILQRLIKQKEAIRGNEAKREIRERSHERLQQSTPTLGTLQQSSMQIQ